MGAMNKPHVVLIPAPGQGHINPIFKLAKLLHSKGIYITFVHTEFHFDKLTKSSPPHSSNLTDGFRYETIPDGLPPDNKRGLHDFLPLLYSLQVQGGEAFRSLLQRLMMPSHDDIPPITCVITDTLLHFPYEIGQELDIPVLIFCTQGTSAELIHSHFQTLAKQGLYPLKDGSYPSDGYLDTPVDCISGLLEGVKLKHISPTINPHIAPMYEQSVRYAVNAGNIIMNTFDDLDVDVIEGIKTNIPNVCTIGPLSLLCQQANVHESGSSLWKEDTKCLEWLDKRSANSVVYVNYGSLTTLTPQQLEEFAWGLANSKQSFLWVVRDNLVDGEYGIMNKEYMEEIKERGLITNWCPQEKVLKHPSVAVFLTHCGWNSMLESIGEGIPMICWPGYGDQPMNSKYACEKWGIGMELREGACEKWEFGMELGEPDVEREKVEEMIRNMMEGEKGKKLRENALAWKDKAEKATSPGGSSNSNLDNLVTWIMEEKRGC